MSEEGLSSALQSSRSKCLALALFLHLPSEKFQHQLESNPSPPKNQKSKHWSPGALPSTSLASVQEDPSDISWTIFVALYRHFPC